MPKEAGTFIGKHWGKRVTEFRDRLFYLTNKRGVTMEEAHLAYLVSVPSEYWMTNHPFKNPKLRFMIEVILGWFSIMTALESSKNREDFLAKYGLPDNTTPLIPRGEDDYKKLALTLGREPKPKTKPKDNEQPKIQRPDQNQGWG
jgi:hypothetical protein